MKSSVLFLAFVLFFGFSILKQTQNSNIYIANESNNLPKLHCQSLSTLEQTLKGQTKKVNKEIDQNWYGKVIENIRKEEYNISYSNELGAYQSPNRANNFRFIYYNDGFTAETREDGAGKWSLTMKLSNVKRERSNVKCKTQDVRCKMLDVNSQWSMVNSELKIDKNKASIENENMKIEYTNDKTGMRQDNYNDQCSMINVQFADLSEDKLIVDGNKASIEDDNMRIEYTNDEKGMRQDFIIKTKPEGEGKLRLNLSADTKLKMIVETDALMFNDKYGNEKMKYSALKVWDAKGKILKAYFERKSNIKNEKANIQIKNQKSKIVNQLSEIPNPKSPACINTYKKREISGRQIPNYKNPKSFTIVVDDKDAIYPITIDPLSTSPDWTAEGNQAFAQFGQSVSTAGDVNGDGYTDVIVGAWNYDNGETDEGRAFAYYGSASGLSSSANWIAECNQVGASFGTSVSTAGDVNDDGYSDVIVGAIGSGNLVGQAFAYYGSASGLSSTANWTTTNGQVNSIFGISVSTAGDVNGDGYSDVIVGAAWYEGGIQVEGKAYVYHGSATGLSSIANWSVESNVFFAQFGWSVSTAGDVNGDGYSEVIVGAPSLGIAFAYYGSATGLSTTANWTGGSNGGSVSTAGDINGDGYSDVIVGGGAEAAFAYYGSASGLSTTANWTTEINQIGAGFGIVSTAGDVNDDGYSDVIVGAPSFGSDSITHEGSVFVYYGSVTGLSSTPGWIANGNQDGEAFGHSVSSAGDVNGDGYSDVIVGASFYDNGETDEGRAYAYYGSPVKVLNLTVFIQGFYRASLNSTIQDTVKAYLRSISPPYSIVDSVKTYLDTLGRGVFAFSDVLLNGVNYYIEVKHRNSIETWSAAGNSFTNNYSTYNFSTSLAQAYGNNMIQVDNSPLRFAIYSGDVNQDGVIDGTDVLIVGNSASIFASGYVVSDLNGDNFVDGSDGLIADNNASNMVAVIRP